ncbi:MAG: flagellar filament capping protein FliD [Candidatus Polarisedimenticolaceae bacterium]|nr:flagellar filament capping protein FliD [Candidatus Polarisedimenticolaceae bacterium]
MPSLSSPGIGSGLDVAGIVSKLMEVERQPLVRLNQKEAKVQAEISGYGSLKSSLSALQASVEKLGDASTFQATQASSSDNDIFFISSTTDAVTSSYDVTVTRLAQQHKVGSSEFADTATFGGAEDDSLTLTMGETSFTLDISTEMTLSEIQAAINIDGNTTGITASLITGDDGNQTLALTSDTEGYDNRVQLSFGGAIDASTFNFSMLNRDGDDVLLASENDLDASLTVDGVTVTRSSNSIDDVIEGVTLNLKTVGQAKATVSLDPTVATSAMGNFVTAYNNLKTQLSSLGSTVGGGVLRNIESQLRSAMNTSVSGLGEYTYLTEFGLSTNADTGKLEFDSSIMTTAMEENPDSVISFFSDSDGGFATKLDTMLEGFVETDGIIDTILEGASARVRQISISRESFENRLVGIEKRYQQQFAALDTLMVNMNTTSEFLDRQLDALADFAVRKS